MNYASSKISKTITGYKSQRKSFHDFYLFVYLLGVQEK